MKLEHDNSCLVYCYGGGNQCTCGVARFQPKVDELEFFIEQLRSTNATLIQQTAEYGQEYLKAEAKVKALEDAHYELALSTNKIIRELNAQIEALEEKLRALIVIITNYGRA